MGAEASVARFQQTLLETVQTLLETGAVQGCNAGSEPRVSSPSMCTNISHGYIIGQYPASTVASLTP